MASRSIVLTMARNAGKQRRRTALRYFSTPPPPPPSPSTSEVEGVAYDQADEEKGFDSYSETMTNDDLTSRIMRLRLPKRSAINVLHRWVSEGNRITISDLRQISKDLRKSQRYKHALEISEWMVTHDEFELSDSDYAVRIDLMTKVFGVDAAEHYFEGLPPSVKTCETYTALLHSYAASKLTEKAEDLFDRIMESNLSLSALTYNELMTLYMSVGQLEKIPLVAEEMKRQKVELDLYTYNLLVSSSAAGLNIDEVRHILDEMKLQSGLNESWLRYVNLARVYISSGHFVNSDFNSLVESEKGITQREWITYDFLIILYGGLGNKDKLDQIWKSLILTKQKMIGRNYACIISSYLILGHLKEVGDIIDQWKQLTTADFDSTICNRILRGFVKVGLTERAATLHMLLAEKGCDNLMEL